MQRFEWMVARREGRAFAHPYASQPKPCAPLQPRGLHPASRGKSVSGATPVDPATHPALPFGPVDQLTTPMMAGPARLVLEYRRAGIARCRRRARRACPDPRDQTRRICGDPRLAGCDQSGEARIAPPPLAVAAHGDAADAGNRETGCRR